MVILGYFLSYLPNLVSVSLFLGTLQIAILMLIGRSLAKQNLGYFLLTLIPSVSSVILRSTSIEFWNQYVLTFINLIFILFALKYLEKPSLWFIPPILVLICIAPALYLAGIVNAFAISILTVGIMLHKRPPRETLAPVLIVSLLIIISSLIFTWIPYFNNINLESIMEHRESEPGTISIIPMIRTAWETFFEFPVYTAFQWGNRISFDEAFKHADARILSASTNLLLKVIARLYLFQAIFAFTTFIYGIVNGKTDTNEFKLKYNQPVAGILTISTLFIIISFTFSVWLGGAAWIKDSRQDQIVQFLPMSLFTIFLLPLLPVINGGIAKIIHRTNYVSMVIFGAVNFICGFMIIYDQLNYRGGELTEADVPLLNKMQVVEFIANDWQNFSDSNIIPVDYLLGGGKWDFVSEFGLLLTPWYPAAFTEGRGFDYALKRQYGLTNLQEGTQLRVFGTGRYLVTYAFEDAPEITDGQITHYIFGRLRVSIVER